MDINSQFYDEISPFYHLIYGDWEPSIAGQSEQLESVICEFWGEEVKTVRDAACDIGTQPLGLAARGLAHFLVFQVWEFHDAIYDLSMYFVKEPGEENCEDRVMQSKYYAVSIEKLMRLMTGAGFKRFNDLIAASFNL